MSFSLEVEESGLVICRASGKVTPEENIEAVDLAGRRIDESGNFNLLVLLEDFEGWGPGNWGDDRIIRFPVEKGGRIEKIAVVGDPKWEEQWLTFVFQPVLSSREARYFAPSQLEEARAWLA